MNFPREHETEITLDGHGYIVIRQEDGDLADSVYVAMSPQRARLVAAELLRLADKADGSAAETDEKALRSETFGASYPVEALVNGR